jgi:hypothetical protein
VRDHPTEGQALHDPIVNNCRILRSIEQVRTTLAELSILTAFLSHKQTEAPFS